MLFTSNALPLLLHLHGFLMTSWLVLFIVQVRLIAAHRVRWHRRLGIAGAVLAALVVIAGAMAAVRAQQLGHCPPGLPVVRGLYAGLVPFCVFAGLVGAALLLRRRGDYHKRLMLPAARPYFIAKAAGPHRRCHRPPVLCRNVITDGRFDVGYATRTR